MFTLWETNQMEREMCSHPEWQLNANLLTLHNFQHRVQQDFAVSNSPEAIQDHHRTSAAHATMVPRQSMCSTPVMTALPALSMTMLPVTALSSCLLYGLSPHACRYVSLTQLFCFADQPLPLLRIQAPPPLRPTWRCCCRAATAGPCVCAQVLY